MRYLLIAIGTRGDVEPFLAAGKLLQGEGHEIHCLFPAQFADLTASTGLNFHPLDKRFLELLETEAGRGIMGQKGSGLKRISQLFKLAKESWGLQKVLVKEQQDIIERIQPDRIVYHPKAVMGRIWGMANPGRTWMLSPVPNALHPSGDHPQIGITRDLGRWGNRLTYRLTNFATARMTNSMASEVARSYPNIRFTTKSLRRYALEREKVIYPISPTLFTKPREWPDRATITGYLERNKTSNWDAPAALSDFLARQQTAGRPIVLVTFGSMVNARPEHTSRLILNVLARTGYAAILNTSSGGLLRLEADPERVHFVSDIPYDYIFPRVHAVIHHGGSGTTHTALKHGCASMILPHIIDQFFWNRRVADLGAGPMGVKISKLNAVNFSALLHELMENATYRSVAEQLGRRMKQEAAEQTFLKVLGHI